MLSKTYEEHLKGGFLNAVINEINTVLVNHNGTMLFPFYIHPPDVGMYNYYLIEDLDDSVGYDKLEELYEKMMAEFEGGDHLCALINGKNLSAVKFYIGRGMFSITEALEHVDTVGINHVIYSSIITDKFKIEDGKVVMIKE